jgi:hypothetical protein
MPLCHRPARATHGNPNARGIKYPPTIQEIALRIPLKSCQLNIDRRPLLNNTHIHGTPVLTEEPSTASQTGMRHLQTHRRSI